MHGHRLAVDEAAIARAQQDDAGNAAQPPVECTRVEPAKSEKPNWVQPAAAPLPGALDRVDHTCEHCDENEEGADAHAFSDRAGHDGGCGRHKHHLEEPV
jgi:hypothetical protein